ncbi:effector-associated constant component EACC1 [Streptomyces sp. bgisy130]|uniref:effector-associated constant component EACC1 n=1 Tax=Streptomyces sp. bgisy130 TaxID=3413788 RepID=UPI003F4A0C3E
MRVEVRVESADNELRSLLNWLRNDPDTRRSAALEMREQPPQEGQMGTVADVLQLVTENGWNAANFVLALAAWKRTRPRASRVTVRRDDLVDALTDCSEEQIARLVHLLQEEQGGGTEGAGR